MHPPAPPSTLHPTSLDPAVGCGHDHVADVAPTDRLDRAGMAISGLCALHCALLPLILAILPTLHFLDDVRIEWALLGGAALVAWWSLHESRRRHRSWRPMVIAGSGLLLLVAGRWAAHLEPGPGGWLYWEELLSATGGLVLVGAHALNLHLRGESRACSSGAVPADPRRPVGAGGRQAMGEAIGEGNGAP